jgi:hypothetical protein
MVCPHPSQISNEREGPALLWLLASAPTLGGAMCCPRARGRECLGQRNDGCLSPPALAERAGRPFSSDPKTGCELDLTSKRARVEERPPLPPRMKQRPWGLVGGNESNAWSSHSTPDGTGCHCVPTFLPQATNPRMKLLAADRFPSPYYQQERPT